jgi:hypothetical protein
MDKRKLLEWLEWRLSVMKNPLTKAIYAGLITRIQSGQFDEAQTPDA